MTHFRFTVEELFVEVMTIMDAVKEDAKSENAKQESAKNSGKVDKKA